MMPAITYVIPSIVNIFEFFNPECLKILISLLLKSFIKKSCAVIKNINGKISNIIAGEFKSDKNNGK